MNLPRQDSTLRLLLEMDRKLDTTLSLLQTASIEEDFPHKGYVLQVSSTGLMLESSEALKKNEHLELLLMLGGYPMRMVSVMGELTGEKNSTSLVDANSKTYSVSYECLSEEDKDSIIAFLFQENRKRIRKQKEGE